MCARTVCSWIPFTKPCVWVIERSSASGCTSQKSNVYGNERYSYRYLGIKYSRDVRFWSNHTRRIGLKVGEVRRYVRVRLLGRELTGYTDTFVGYASNRSRLAPYGSSQRGFLSAASLLLELPQCLDTHWSKY